MQSTNINSVVLSVSLISFSTFVNSNLFHLYYPKTNEEYMGICSYDKGNYTNSTTNPFKSNLTMIFSNLTYSASSPNITFANITSGSGQDTAHAWFFCSGVNYNPDRCSSCVEYSTQILLGNCLAKTAISYSFGPHGIFCQVWYTNTTIFPESDATSLGYSSSSIPNMPDPVSLNQTVVRSMLKIIDQVITNSSSNSARESFLGLYMGQRVETFVRCLPGVSKLQCKDCLFSALNQTMVNYLSFGVPWAIQFRKSCHMRYDSTVASNSSFEPVPSPSLSPSPTISSSFRFDMSRWFRSLSWMIMATIFL